MSSSSLHTNMIPSNQQQQQQQQQQSSVDDDDIHINNNNTIMGIPTPLKEARTTTTTTANTTTTTATTSIIHRLTSNNRKREYYHNKDRKKQKRRRLCEARQVLRYPLGRPIGDLLNTGHIYATHPTTAPCGGYHVASLYNITTTYDKQEHYPTPITNIPLHLRTLDIFTSGIVMVAHDYGSYYQLRHQFKNRTVLKKYICLVHGDMDGDDTGVIHTKIKTYYDDKKKKMTKDQQEREQYHSTSTTSCIATGSDGKDAITKWRVIQRYNVNVKKNR
ncbi:hypothetical protein FOZ62_014029 [Perkinsus olseni]|uniref:Pseudouridine synthase RsuA/RluA-like domain-containing protein n=1 Tax=Perkinsus olseni TaxID=32597 RepID=A0A7J6U6Q2_PEROL|nr:hypothetical protein FOZ62_014029 [Perkinsus olseni]